MRLPTQEMCFPSLGWEDPLEQEKATHSSVLTWKIPWTEEPGRLQSMRSQRVGHDLAIEQQYMLLFSRQVVSDSLRPNELQPTRFLCPSLSPRVCSDSCTLSQWCHPAVSSSVITFSSRPHSFPASGSFPVSWLLVSGGQSIGASASALVLPITIQGYFL